MPDLAKRPTKFVIILAAAAIAWAFISTRLMQWPNVPLDQIEGRYHNSCCTDIVITRKYVEYGKAKEEYSVQLTKYGTEITPNHLIDQFYHTNIDGVIQINTFVITRKGDNILLQTRSNAGTDYSFEKIE